MLELVAIVHHAPSVAGCGGGRVHNRRRQCSSHCLWRTFLLVWYTFGSIVSEKTTSLELERYIVTDGRQRLPLTYGDVRDHGHIHKIPRVSPVDISWKAMHVGAKSHAKGLRPFRCDNHQPLPDRPHQPGFSSAANNGPQPAITSEICGRSSRAKSCWHTPLGQDTATWTTSTTACMNVSIAAYSTSVQITHQPSRFFG